MKADRSYPAWLSAFWTSRATRGPRGEGALPLADAAGRLAPVAVSLSDLLTTDRREGFGGYAADPDRLLAYGLFLFPRTFHAVRCALAETLDRAFPGGLDRESWHVLDLGAGTGAGAAAAVLGLAERGARRVEVTAVDREPESLAFARELFGEAPLAGISSLRAERGDLRVDRAIPGGPWDLVLLAFSVNEAFHAAEPGTAAAAVARLLETHARSLSPGGVLLAVEPALAETARRLEEARDLLAAGGETAMIAPCTHRLPCPLRGVAGAWCHEVRSFEPPPEVHLVNRRLHRDVTGVKFSFLALGGRGAPPADPPAVDVRLLSTPTRENGKASAWGCASDGSRVRVEALRRDRDAHAALLARSRGDVVRFEHPERLAGGTLLRPGRP